MARLVQYKECCLRILRQRFHVTRSRTFCAGKPIITGKSEQEMGEAARLHDAYRQLDNIDFMTAAKILLTAPPKRKKFGLDFHLVQLFFCCLPSLAVYLVAQYARHEMRKMEAELEVKRKAEEAAKAKELARIAAEEKVRGPEAQISEVKERLDKLESAIKKVAIDKKIEVASNKSREEEASPTVDAKKEYASNKGTEEAASPIVVDGHVSSESQSQVDGRKANKVVEPSPLVCKSEEKQ